VVKTKTGCFLQFFRDYVVPKRVGVTDGYGQGSAVSKKLTALEATVLLGFSEA
jgi:hypothetical protein